MKLRPRYNRQGCLLIKNLFAVVIIFITVFSSCSKTTDPEIVLAEYSLGTGGNCTDATVSGRFVADTALTDLHTVTVTVDVTVPGAYWITTNTVNGITFSKIGTFTGTGPQTAVLTGEGIPLTTDTFNFTLTAMNGLGGSCNFSVATVQGIPPRYFITALFDGVYRNFSDSATASNSNIPGTSGFPGLDITGLDTITTSNSKVEFGLSNATAVNVGTYTDTTSAQAYLDYVDSVGDTWSIKTSVQPSFTIVVTGAASNSVQGSFSGTIRNQKGFGTDSITVTNGLFSVPVK